jgi:hypothetical protein
MMRAVAIAIAALFLATEAAQASGDYKCGPAITVDTYCAANHRHYDFLGKDCWKEWKKRMPKWVGPDVDLVIRGPANSFEISGKTFLGARTLRLTMTKDGSFFINGYRCIGVND